MIQLQLERCYRPNACQLILSIPHRSLRKTKQDVHTLTKTLGSDVSTSRLMFKAATGVVSGKQRHANEAKEIQNQLILADLQPGSIDQGYKVCIVACCVLCMCACVSAV